MNIFRILPITVLSLFVMGCGLTTTGDSDGNATLPASNETKQNFEEREYDDRRGNDHEKAIEEMRADIHHIFESITFKTSALRYTDILTTYI